MAGPGKKPTHLKAVAGTSRPDREPAEVVDLPTLDRVPDAPDWLPNAHAMKEWERLAPVLVNNRLLTDAGLMAFGHLCALHGKLVQLWAAGESPTGHLLSQYRALINDFGLTPVAQGKVKLAGDKPKENQFSRNGRRPA
jgi:hypothetical protein